jgi:homoserine O-succinyltransferase/O-acetyltransferase
MNDHPSTPSPDASSSASRQDGNGITPGPAGAPAILGGPRPFRLCIVDMNDGHVNQAMRCFRSIAARFFQRVTEANPGVECKLVEVSPRNTEDDVPRDCDLYLSSGGPGSPFDGDGKQWPNRYYRYLDDVVEAAEEGGADQKALFAVCYSFEMIIRHFKIAEMKPRAERKFGVMPVYTTPEGQEHPLLAPFADRLFAFEHRNWEAIDLDTRKLAALGGQLLARESRDGVSKGRAVLGVDVTSGIEAVQFHPEADRAGVVSWVSRPDQAAAFKATYGEVTYAAMLRTLDDPRRLARTYALVIPGWLARKFNLAAPERGYSPVAPPNDSDVLEAFGVPDPSENLIPPSSAAPALPVHKPAPASAASAG